MSRTNYLPPSPGVRLQGVHPADIPPLPRYPPRGVLPSLRELADTFVLLHTVLLRSHGGLPFDPVAEASAALDFPAWYCLYPLPVLTGLPEPFDRLLHLVQPIHFPRLCDHLRSAGGILTARRFFWRAVYQQIPLPSLPAFSPSGKIRPDKPVPDPILLHAFGVESNRGTFGFALSEDPLASPYLLNLKPTDAFLQLSQQVLGDNLEVLAENDNETKERKAGHHESA